MIFNSVLIANRGEIACRIIRTVKAMGLRSVAVYSDADRHAPHVNQADHAIHIGASPAAESYMNIPRLIEAAKMSGAQAIHPGYGFLSENAEFARASAEAEIVFIGPSPEAITLMGDKAAAKTQMIAAGVPVLPGYQGPAQDDKTLHAEAQIIGFPLMVKAAAGGGGRGMRLVKQSDDLDVALSTARAEALGAFGSDTLILERALQRPRHVEVQIFGDQHGNLIHLGERDCSVQRRHQKVLEEAPCPIMTPDLRGKMGLAAIEAAKTVNYVGAGTVEFLLDEDSTFYFLEMNTRLQVEHPVTEMITGLDLVALQIRIAQGLPLNFSQTDIHLNGHAIEARLYAENPAQNFLPATGKISHLEFPTGVRIDTGVKTGSEISPFYDPMIAKIIAYGTDRETALRRLQRALKETILFGVETNRQFLIEALEQPDFISGEAKTDFVETSFSSQALKAPEITPEIAVLAAITQFHISSQHAAACVPSDLLGWMSASALKYPFQFGPHKINLTPRSAKQFEARTEEDDLFSISIDPLSGNSLKYQLQDQAGKLTWHSPNLAEIHLHMGKYNYTLTNTLAVTVSARDAIGIGDIRSPMHGALTQVFVKKGEAVKSGTRLAVIEAMKMQHDILADMNGTIEKVSVKAGTQIAANEAMFKIIS